MASDSDSDYIEETSYVIMDLSADLTEEAIRTLTEKRDGMALTDLTESPIYAQLGTQTFCGELDDPVGSYLLFEMEEKKTDASGLLPMLSSMRQTENGIVQEEKQTKWQAKYRHQVDKVIKAKQVEIALKSQDVEATNKMNTDTDKEDQAAAEAAGS
ncbi:hypothetical protein BCR42DRAFT_428304 [Absidia repens]|uniref:Transcription factor TFIIIC triple barrel domain-containing protein n=1 Tax=Absidia repens TaxID=90262 RepID=A0A1X2HYQ8_9FUNG|nr:hypothetical protein BCR42DRAFT_428304 [Absidia repens]